MIFLNKICVRERPSVNYSLLFPINKNFKVKFKINYSFEWGKRMEQKSYLPQNGLMPEESA